MKHSITTDIHVPEGKEAIISMVDAKRWIIPFKPLGKRFDRNPETIEAIEHICKFNKDELYLLQQRGIAGPDAGFLALARAASARGA